MNIKFRAFDGEKMIQCGIVPNLMSDGFLACFDGYDKIYTRDYSVYQFTGAYDSVFSCTSPGPVQDKRVFLREKDSLIGKDVTVKFQEKTPAGIPRFPICIAVRDYE